MPYHDTSQHLAIMRYCQPLSINISFRVCSDFPSPQEERRNSSQITVSKRSSPSSVTGWDTIPGCSHICCASLRLIYCHQSQTASWPSTFPFQDNCHGMKWTREYFNIILHFVHLLSLFCSATSCWANHRVSLGSF